jgi:DNA-directed RNA polymerase subunit M/transcription elongation factor TFIIS
MAIDRYALRLKSPFPVDEVRIQLKYQEKTLYLVFERATKTFVPNEMTPYWDEKKRSFDVKAPEGAVLEAILYIFRKGAENQSIGKMNARPPGEVPKGYSSLYVLEVTMHSQFTKMGVRGQNNLTTSSSDYCGLMVRNREAFLSKQFLEVQMIELKKIIEDSEVKREKETLEDAVKKAREVYKAEFERRKAYYQQVRERQAATPQLTRTRVDGTVWRL